MFRVAIVGRPNVGKSTLFNRLVGRRKALVHDTPGVTRDRREAEAQLGDLIFTAIDTAGLDEAPARSLAARMHDQTGRALADADVILFVFDGRAGVTGHDRHFANWLRRAGRPIVVVANKCEGRAGQSGIAEAAGLGLGEAIGISAEHGEGLADLHAALRPYAPEDAILPHQEAREEQTAPGADSDPGAEAERAIRVAVVGRPNVGKSTLVNRLVGEERLLTGAEPGITRDAIEIPWTSQGRNFVLVDTAGLRKKARIEDRLERLSTAETIQAVREAQVAILVLDATAMLEKQDLSIARLVIEEGRVLVLAINKWDLVDDPAAAARKLKDRVERSLAQVPGVATVMVSALHGRKLDALVRAVVEGFETWNTRLPTPPLNRWLEGMTESHPPPLVRGRRPRLRFMRQVATRPPTFAIFGAKLTTLPDDYLRYLTNGLRETFKLRGTVIRIVLRQTENPYVDE
ncbi:MAG TPA: ribosome biogenesis GTPase Der [Alphaproteobacteria bacterium]|nr:ribosome biogenesis GTPase Der [Alphaproteobacteria bacterium]